MYNVGSNKYISANTTSGALIFMPRDPQKLVMGSILYIA